MGIYDDSLHVPIYGHVSKPGRHDEFVMGSGELPGRVHPFPDPLSESSSAFLRPGGIQFCLWTGATWARCWPLARRPPGVEEPVRLEQGLRRLGSLYRSQHELVFVFRDPKGPGVNNVQLGNSGATAPTSGITRSREPAQGTGAPCHPEKRDPDRRSDSGLSQRNDIVLDAFSGSGTTIIAGEKVGRRGYVGGLDPQIVDVAVKRWEAWSGEMARHAADRPDLCRNPQSDPIPRNRRGHAPPRERSLLWPLNRRRPPPVRVRQRARAA